MPWWHYGLQESHFSEIPLCGFTQQGVISLWFSINIQVYYMHMHCRDITGIFISHHKTSVTIHVWRLSCHALKPILRNVSPYVITHRYWENWMIAKCNKIRPVLAGRISNFSWFISFSAGRLGIANFRSLLWSAYFYLISYSPSVDFYFPTSSYYNHVSQLYWYLLSLLSLSRKKL